MSILNPTNVDGFVITVDHTSSTGYSPLTFTYADYVKKANIIDITISQDAIDGTEYECVAVGPFKLAVYETVPNESSTFLGFATINNRFNNHVAFTIKPRWLEYYLVGDADSFIAYEASLHDAEQYSGVLDETDFFPSINIRTEHGVVTDPYPPLHAPVEYYFDNVRVGVVRQRTITLPVLGEKPQYIFEFDAPPPKGYFIEAKVEHSTQLQPRVEAAIKESASLVSRIELGYDIESFDDYNYGLDSALEIINIE